MMTVAKTGRLTEMEGPHNKEIPHFVLQAMPSVMRPRGSATS